MDVGDNRAVYDESMAHDMSLDCTEASIALRSLAPNSMSMSKSVTHDIHKMPVQNKDWTHLAKMMLTSCNTSSVFSTP